MQRSLLAVETLLAVELGQAVLQPRLRVHPPPLLDSLRSEREEGGVRESLGVGHAEWLLVQEEGADEGLEAVREHASARAARSVHLLVVVAHAVVHAARGGDVTDGGVVDQGRAEQREGVLLVSRAIVRRAIVSTAIVSRAIVDREWRGMTCNMQLEEASYNYYGSTYYGSLTMAPRAWCSGKTWNKKSEEASCSTASPRCSRR